MLDLMREGAVLTMTLNRPEVRNALNEELIGRLQEAFDGADSDVRVVVLCAAGTAFCAGGDLEWMRRAAGWTRVENVADALRLARLYRTIAEFRAPVVARVQGPAFGGGCGLVAACDIAIAEETAKFSFSEVKLGMVPATISTHVVPKIGRSHARALFLTGEAFDAERALRIGLVHEVCPGSEALEKAMDRTIAQILASGPAAIATSKVLVARAPIEEQEAAELLADVRARDEAREGMSAFLEKRKASFVQRWERS